MIRGLDIKAVLLVATVAPDSEVAVLKVDTLCGCHVRLRVSIVHLFRKHSRLPMKVSLVSLVTLVRVAVYF